MYHSGHPEILTVSVVFVDIDVFGFFNKNHTDYESHTCNDDWVPQAVVHIASLRHDRESGGG